MGLEEEAAAIVSKGEGCVRGRYKVSENDLAAIKKILDEVDGPSPYVTYNHEAVRRTLAGGSKASVGCMTWNLNNIISDDEKLAEFGIYAHTDHGNVRFDKNAPRRTEAEPP